MSIYLIDGYNLMYEMLGRSAENISRRKKDHPPIPDLEDQRKQLIDQIANYMGGTNDRAIVVFDSRNQELQKSESATRNMEVYFGSFSRSADDIIAREVYTLNAGENIIVVTSDYGIQKVVFRYNVVRRSSRQFAIDLQESTKLVAKSGKCIIMDNRVENRLSPDVLNKLIALQQELEEPTN